jgi:ATP synthase B subunit
VRYEGQVKQRQQKELAESIIAKVTKELENPKALQQILQQSVADVESECPRDCHAGTTGWPTSKINHADAYTEILATKSQ